MGERERALIACVRALVDELCEREQKIDTKEMEELIGILFTAQNGGISPPEFL
jgi:hypothetical protein